jgi:outer membrane protein, heavy metal efflux system
MLFSSVRLLLACSSVFFWLASSAFAAATAYEPEGVLTLTGAVQTALQRNPDLAVSEYTLKTGEARITQAGLRSNPTLSLELEDFLGTGAVSGVKAMQTTLSLSHVIELGDKRQLRRNAAASNLELDSIARQAQQLDVLAEVTRRFIAVVAAQEKLRLNERAVTVSDATLRAIDTRVQAARSPEAERSRARIALTRAKLEQQHGIVDLQSARHALAALWGSNSPQFSQANADLFALPDTASYANLMQDLLGNPDFIRFASETRLRDAELRLAQAQTRANLNLSIGVRRLEASDDTALVAGFSIPLQVFDRHQGAIREAELRRAQTQAQQQAAQIKAESTLFGLYQALQANRARMNTLRDAVLPQAQQALEQTQYGYERGRFSYLELAVAQRELLELESAAIDAAADSQQMLCEIERLTGKPLAETSR